jgi:hypothetical protein
MVTEFFLKIFLLISLGKSIESLPSLPDIDATLSSTNENSIYEQAALVKKLTDLQPQIQTCTDALKAQNIAPKLVTYLEIIAQLVQQFSTMDYFEAYENVSTCDDINYKITLMDFDVRKYRDIIVKCAYNSSQLTQNYVLANQQYVSK